MKKNYKNSCIKLSLALVVVSLFSCKEKNGLAPEYMPDMFRSPSIETYVDYGEVRDKQHPEMKDKISAMLPVKGTIPRGFTPYPYENTPEGYELAGANLKNPLVYNEQVVKEGEVLFGMFCVHCHGTTGQGDGILVQREKFPPLPVKFAPGLAIPEGKMFHSITYGRNLMGAHASQLTKEERWKLVLFIRTKFMNENQTTIAIDSNAVDSVVTKDVSQK
ncbi:MAG: cytochrome c [Bacteroidetes bacterium]|nr:cytochrome c [Bacteroidota bacterium]